MKNESERVVEELVDRFPALRPVLEEHVADNEELLPHVFFGDISRYAERLHEDGHVAELTGLLDYLEGAFATGPGEVENLIWVSFIENLACEPERAGMRDLLGPRLREAWSHYE